MDILWRDGESWAYRRIGEVEDEALSNSCETLQHMRHEKKSRFTLLKQWHFFGCNWSCKNRAIISDEPNNVKRFQRSCHLRHLFPWVHSVLMSWRHFLYVIAYADFTYFIQVLKWKKTFFKTIQSSRNWCQKKRNQKLLMFHFFVNQK